MVKSHTAWKVSKYRVISGPYFRVFGLNTEIYEVNLRIQSKYRKTRTRNNSVFVHFSRSHRVIAVIKNESSHLRCKLLKNCLNVHERVEVVERNKDGPSLPLLSQDLLKINIYCVEIFHVDISTSRKLLESSWF